MSQLLERGTTGIYVPIDGAQADTAAALDVAGYDTFWIAGGQLDSFDRVGELLDGSRSAQVATGIVPLGVYDVPAIVAEHARRAETHPGRFVLGLGGPQQERPLPALRRYLDELDAAGVGAEQRLLAALGPRKMQIAAERSAGAITLMTTPESTAQTRRELGDGPVLAVHQMAVLDSDGERARDAVRENIGFLARVPGYRANVRRMGFDDAELDAVSDRLVDALTAWGDADAIAGRVAEHREAGADHVALSVFPSAGGPDVRATGEALASALDLPTARSGPL